METVNERLERERKLRREQRDAERDREAQLVRELFEGSDLGREVLGILRRRFPADGRRFRAANGSGTDPWAAAVRDGEGAVTAWICGRIDLANVNERKRSDERQTERN